MDQFPLPQKHHTNPLLILTKNQLTYTFFFISLLFTFFVLYFNNITTPFNPNYNLLGNIGFLSQIFPNRKTNKEISSRSITCDYSYGKWVRDESYPLRSYTEDCPFLDPGFQCGKSGRPDVDFHKWRWQPKGCDVPRFNAVDFLERSRNGRIVFAGDSIGRNQWESLLCMLSKVVSNQSTIYEERGSPITKHKGFLSMRFQEYNLTVEYYRVPFLVVIDRPPKNTPKDIRSAIRVDKLHWYSTKWVGADVLVFSAGHWWNEEKTVKMVVRITIKRGPFTSEPQDHFSSSITVSGSLLGPNYSVIENRPQHIDDDLMFIGRGWRFQEGGTMNMTMTIMEAFGKSLQTLKLWALQKLDPERTRIIFRSYSPVHYRDGAWNEGGHCDTNTVPETDYTKLETEPLNNQLLFNIVQQMKSEKRSVELINITYLTELRKDGHPSKYREPGTPQSAPQDCSHWCLPGVPDTWNELLYAQLLANGFRTRSK